MAAQDPAPMIDDIYRDKVQRARAQKPVDKLLAGLRLFESGLALTTIDVIRHIGTADEAAVRDALSRRFERVRRVREAAIYRPIEHEPVEHGR